jgi:hypothetical protein
MSRLLIWGAGQHGRVVGELVVACGHEVAGFVDRSPRNDTTVSEDAVRLGRELPFGATGLVPAIGANDVRLALLAEFAGRIAPALIHPRAFVAPSAKVGAGTVVLPMAVVSSNAVIGAGVILHPGVVVDHDALIEDGVYLAPGVIVAGSSVVKRGQTLPVGTALSKVTVVG